MITRLRQLLRPCYGDKIEVRPRRWWNRSDRQSAKLAAKVLEKDLLDRRWITPERRKSSRPDTH